MRDVGRLNGLMGKGFLEMYMQLLGGECEVKLAQLIRESKIELAELKRAQKKASKSIAK